MREKKKKREGTVGDENRRGRNDDQCHLWRRPGRAFLGGRKQTKEREGETYHARALWKQNTQDTYRPSCRGEHGEKRACPSTRAPLVCVRYRDVDLLDLYIIRET